MAYTTRSSLYPFFPQYPYLFLFVWGFKSFSTTRLGDLATGEVGGRTRTTCWALICISCLNNHYCFMLDLLIALHVLSYNLFYVTGFHLSSLVHLLSCKLIIELISIKLLGLIWLLLDYNLLIQPDISWIFNLFVLCLIRLIIIDSTVYLQFVFYQSWYILMIIFLGSHWYY